MTLVLDSGGLSALARSPARLEQIRARGLWPPIVPVAVLVESLTGDHRRDFHLNRLLRACTIRADTELIGRHAAALRFATRREGINAVDALVVAFADHAGGGMVFTSDPKDLQALAANTIHPVSVAGCDR